ncbi:hypothetical protein BHE74_00021357 [Ensete ventricosum]|nr:hypothetical protein BHE74_00021357 [Ensete ventricosum]
MIGMKPVTGFSRGSNSRKDFLFAMDHLNIRMLMDNLLKFVNLLWCQSIKVDLNDYQIKPKISPNCNRWAHSSKGVALMISFFLSAIFHEVNCYLT